MQHFHQPSLTILTKRCKSTLLLPKARTVYDPHTIQVYENKLRDYMNQHSPTRWKYAASKRQAAVLVPLCLVNHEPSILFTVRSSTMRNHRGEVSFPGGILEQQESLSQCVLRETQEELGISPSNIHLLGHLHSVPDKTMSIEVTPFLGIIKTPLEPQSIQFNPDEVDYVFHIPLHHLIDPQYKMPDSETFKRTGQSIPSWKVPDHVKIDLKRESLSVWGLSGYILHHMLTHVFTVDS